MKWVMTQPQSGSKGDESSAVCHSACCFRVMQPVSAWGMALPTVEMCVSFYFIIIVELIAHTHAPRGLSPG